MCSKKKLFGLAGTTFASVILFFPFLHSIYWLGDEGILLHGSAELLSGKKLYSDFWEFYPPGGFLITEAWMTVFGDSLISLHSLAIISLIGIACFTYLISEFVSSNVILSAILSIAWATNTQGWILVDHHWFTTFFSMIAFYLALLSIKQEEKSFALPLGAGLAAGVAAMVTSSRGIFAIIALLITYTKWPNLKSHLVYSIIGSLIIPLLCLLYIISNGEFYAAFNDIIFFTFQGYASIQNVAFGAFGARYTPARMLFPLTALATIALLLVKRKSPSSLTYLWPCMFFGLAGFLGIYPRPDITHIDFCLPLILPLFAYLISEFTRNLSYRRRLLILVFLVIVFSRHAVSFLHDDIQSLRAPTFDTSAGKVALVGDEQDGGSDVFEFIENQPISAKFLFYPYMPMMPFLTHRIEVSELDLFQPNYTSKQQYFYACIATTKDADWIVLNNKWMRPDHWKALYPAMKSPSPPDTKAFEQAILDNSTFVHDYGEFEIRKRNSKANASDCRSILSNTQKSFPKTDPAIKLLGAGLDKG